MIGICVVYHVRDAEGVAILDASIAALRRMTRGPYRIYGVVPGADGRTIRRLRHHGVLGLELSRPRIPGIAAIEHSTLLNALADRAVADGCSHVATFDMDSWPIVHGWDEIYPAILSRETPLAAIVRNELGDNFPFAAFAIFPANFWRVGESSFSVEVRGQFSDAALTTLTRAETGSGIAAQLFDGGQRFLRLERSNTWTPHPLLAACYDNTVFHLGAMSRMPRFVTDAALYGLNGDPLREAYRDAMNRAARDFTVARLLDSHDSFVSALTGERPALAPIPADPLAVPPPPSATDLTERPLLTGAPPPCSAPTPALYRPLAARPVVVDRALKLAGRVRRRLRPA